MDKKWIDKNRSNIVRRAHMATVRRAEREDWPPCVILTDMGFDTFKIRQRIKWI